MMQAESGGRRDDMAGASWLAFWRILKQPPVYPFQKLIRRANESEYNIKDGDECKKNCETDGYARQSPALPIYNRCFALLACAYYVPLLVHDCYNKRYHRRDDPHDERQPRDLPPVKRMPNNKHKSQRRRQNSSHHSTRGAYSQYLRRTAIR